MEKIQNNIEFSKSENQSGIVLKPSLTLECLDPKFGAIILDSCSRFSQETKNIMSQADIDSFQTILQSNLPKEVYEKIKDISSEDIVKIMSAIVLSALLIATGVGVIPAVAAIGARLGLTAVFTRVITMGLTRPGAVSAIMGVIPGMKMLAPNQNIALTTNFFKDIFLYILPGTISKLNSNKK